MNVTADLMSERTIRQMVKALEDGSAMPAPWWVRLPRHPTRQKLMKTWRYNRRTLSKCLFPLYRVAASGHYTSVMFIKATARVSAVGDWLVVRDG